MPKIISADSPEIKFRKRPVRGVSLFIGEDIITAMTDHADAGYLENKEVLGLLIGQILKDDEGVYVLASDSVTAGLVADDSSVKFKEEALEGLFDKNDRHSGSAVVGWYHSHLGIGCFLSEVDIRTHTGLFGDEAGFAVVIDPSDSTLATFSCDKNGPKKIQMIVMT